MEDLRRQVIELQHRIHDLMDTPHDSAAIRLSQEVQGLEDDLQVKKNPLTVEDRIRRIIHILEGDAKAHRIMNYEHLDMLRHQFEHMREVVRRLR